MKRNNQLTWILNAAVGLLAFGLAAHTGYAGPAASKKSPTSTESVKIGVISDPHLYQARLGTSGLAWQINLYKDPKLLKESEAIFEAATASLAEQGVKILIIPGDLTKDGELASHVLMAQHLQKLRQQGIQTYVIPGNHDINNPDAVRYVGTQPNRCRVFPRQRLKRSTNVSATARLSRATHPRSATLPSLRPACGSWASIPASTRKTAKQGRRS